MSPKTKPNPNATVAKLSEMLDLRVTAESRQGDRESMEDDFSVAYHATLQDPNDPKNSLYAYVGVFDGHGGSEASTYARANLLNHITSQEGFWSGEDEPVLEAIRSGFMDAQQEMQKERVSWRRTRDGLQSNAGTTATVAFIMRGKLFIGHVGDSAIILGYEDRDDPSRNGWKARQLTRDHKPYDPAEMTRIQESGGSVALDAAGHPRVVWQRPCQQPAELPFLAMSRALGNFWSFNVQHDKFVVSPEPDTSVIDIDPETFRCLVIASDGVVDALLPQEVVDHVYQAHMSNIDKLPPGVMGSTAYINPSRTLVSKAFDEWASKDKRADNATAVTVMIGLAGSPKVLDSVPPPIPVSIPPTPIKSTVMARPSSSSPVSSPSMLMPYEKRTILTRRHAVKLLEYFKGLVDDNCRGGEIVSKKSVTKARIGTGKTAPSGQSTRASRKLSTPPGRKQRGGRKIHRREVNK